MNRQAFITFSILAFLLLVTIGVVLYGKGYRFGFQNGRPDLLGTGLLVATSTPNGAQVFVNGHLTTATDNTINLSPGEYTIKIFKEGYFAWEKKLKIKKEVVTKGDALLFPTAPKLESLTNIGVKNPVLDPSQTRLAFSIAYESAIKNGIYILDLTNKPILTLQSASKQVVDDTINNFSNSSFSWSPDGSALIATVSAQATSASYLLSGSDFNQNPQDVTATLLSVSRIFEKQKQDKEKLRADSLDKKTKRLVLDYFKVVDWSPDETKVLYLASQSATLPIVITPRLIDTDVTPEDRNLSKGGLYVYDFKEDKNFKISVDLGNSKISWMPDSRHFIYVHDKKIDVLESDNTNLTTIYAGPFIDGFVFPWSDSTKIVILTNLGNPAINPNLYTIVLK